MNINPPQHIVAQGRYLFLLTALAMGLALGNPEIHAAGLWSAEQVQASGASSGVPVLRDFEDLEDPTGTAVFNQYEGVTFVGGDILDPFGNHPITIVQPTQATVSPIHVARGHSFACEFINCLVLSLSFDIPQYRVSLSTGLANTLANNGVEYTIRMQGFTAAPGNMLIAQSTASCLGFGPTPITTPTGTPL